MNTTGSQEMKRFQRRILCLAAILSIGMPATAQSAASHPLDEAFPAPVPSESVYHFGGVDGRAKVKLSLYPHILGVTFDSNVSPTKARRILSRIPGIDVSKLAGTVPEKDNFYWVSMQAGSTLSQAQTASSNLVSNPFVLTAHPGMTSFPGGILGLKNQILIAFDASQTPTEVANILSSHNLAVVRELDTAIYTYVVRVPPGQNAQALSNSLVNTYGTSTIQYAHPNYVAPKEEYVIPNDPLFERQWHLDATGNHPQFGVLPDADIDAPEAWDTVTGENITIAVMDTGIEMNHPDLDVIAPGLDLAGHSGSGAWQHASEQHSTAVSGVAAALGNNGRGVSGVCQNCRVLPIRFLAPGIDLGDEAQGLNFARTEGAEIVNNSWGPTNGVQDPLPTSTRVALERAATEGRDGKGMLVFFASGNSGGPVPQNGYVNSNLTMAVGASTNQDKFANYTSRSEFLDFVAPSGDGSDSGGIWTTDMIGQNGYSAARDYTGSLAGTSFSCPQAAGIAALILQANPNLVWTQVRDIMRSTADVIDPTHSSWTNGFSSYYGHGKLNADAAVQLALNTSPPNPLAATDIFPWGNGGSVNVSPGATSFAVNHIPEDGDIRELTLLLTPNHPDHSDLRVDLRHPDGTVVNLWNEGSGTMPSSFTFNTFNGRQLQGAWTLEVHGKSGGGSGSLENLQLVATYIPDVPPSGGFGSGTYSWNPINVVPGATTSAPRPIPDQGSILTATLNLQANHPDHSDLRVQVRHPDGTLVTLWDEQPGTMPTTFNLSVLGGKPLAGTWLIVAHSKVGGEPGTLTNINLQATYTPPGPASGTITTTQFHSANVPLPIPDQEFAGVQSDIVVTNVAQHGVVQDIDVSVDISHGDIGDLKIYLVSPTGDYALLHKRTGNGVADLTTTYDTLTEPTHPLTIFNSKDAEGVWKLWVVDHGAGGVGSIEGWSLHVTSVIP